MHYEAEETSAFWFKQADEIVLCLKEFIRLNKLGQYDTEKLVYALEEGKEKIDKYLNYAYVFLGLELQEIQALRDQDLSQWN